MLGTRGVRLGILHPEIYEMQVRGDRSRAARCASARAAARRGHGPARRLRARARAAARPASSASAEREGLDASEDYLVGTMIELPRACLHGRPHRRARRLLLVRHQRPDPDGARLLARRHRGRASSARYIDMQDPRPLAVRDDRRARASGSSCGWARGSGARREPDLKLGVCGEHGGDPDSIAFFHAQRASTTCPARRTACRSPGSPRRRRRSPARPSRASPSCRAHPGTAWHGRTVRSRRWDNVGMDVHRALRARRRGLRRPPGARGRRERLRRGAARSYPARRRVPEEDCGAAHAAPARPRPDRPLQGVPPPQAQDAGLRRARGRPLPHAADPHARGHADRAHRGPGAAPQRGPRRGDRPGPRPRPPAVRPHRRGRARRAACASASGPAASATTSTRCASSTSSSGAARA